MSEEGLSLGNEGRKFLRYVMPGLVFGVETLLLFYVALPEPAVNFLDKVSGKDASFATIAGVFLASGGLGYIFASIHHWYLWYFEKGIFNHLKVIRTLPKIQKDKLDTDDLQLVESTDTLKARETAQSISLALWHYNVKLKPREKDYLDYLGNQAHGLGAARIASLFALLTTVCLCKRYGDLKCLWLTPDFAMMIILGGFIIYIFQTGFRRVARMAQKIYNKTLLDFLQ